MRSSTHCTLSLKGIAIAAAALLLAALSAPVEASERTASNSRTGSVSRSDISTKGSSSSTTSTSRGSASSTRSGGSGGGTATRTQGSRPPRGQYSDNYRYSHRGYWGTYFGFYPGSYYGYSGYYGRYGYPYYYPMSPMLYYGPRHGGEYGGRRLGALDLNVKPKKTEVWVDGQLVGTSGKFDGFPGYLWLERGRHQLILYRPGFATEVSEVRVLQGTVVKVNLRMTEGESIPPQQLAKQNLQRRPRRPKKAAAPQIPVVEETAEAVRQPMMRKVKVEPGRLVLAIEPSDASVYLDGRFLGSAAELSRLHAGLLVNPGQHTLEVVRPGFRAERMELDVEADVETEISVNLESN